MLLVRLIFALFEIVFFRGNCLGFRRGGRLRCIRGELCWFLCRRSLHLGRWRIVLLWRGFSLQNVFGVFGFVCRLLGVDIFFGFFLLELFDFLNIFLLLHLLGLGFLSCEFLRREWFKSFCVAKNSEAAEQVLCVKGFMFS